MCYNRTDGAFAAALTSRSEICKLQLVMSTYLLLPQSRMLKERVFLLWYQGNST